jgi:hypothetical protein
MCDPGRRVVGGRLPGVEQDPGQEVGELVRMERKHVGHVLVGPDDDAAGVAVDAAQVEDVAGRRVGAEHLRVVDEPEPQEGIGSSTLKNKPAYAIASVYSALSLASLLQQEGAMRVTDVAARLGVSVSTAHRLLGMLVYRDFAEQLPDRRYAAGRS